jgi:hypothetical protein
MHIHVNIFTQTHTYTQVLRKKRRVGLRSHITRACMCTYTHTHIHTYRYSEKSDVWAFGVTSWEIFTEGSIPYFDMSQDDRVIAHVCGGGRLKREELTVACHENVWSIISSCWADTAADRPPFSRLVLLLAKALGDAGSEVKALGEERGPAPGKLMQIRVSYVERYRGRDMPKWTKTVDSRAGYRYT